MLARSFLIESSSKLLVTRTGIKAWSSSILGRIRPLILELLALEWQKFHTFELEYLWSQLANLDQNLCIASLVWGKGCIRWPDWPWHIGLRWAIVALWATCFHDLINVYSRRSGADNPRGQNFDVNRNLLSLQSFATSLKKNLFEVWFYTIFFHDFIHVYTCSPGAGDDNP